MKLYTRISVLSGYFIICGIISWIAFSYLDEWRTLENLEDVAQETNDFMDKTNRLNAAIIELSLAGESFMVWDENGKVAYRQQLSLVDSLLNNLGIRYQIKGIDSLRILLKEKATRLDNLKDTYDQWLDLNTSITNKIPVIARQSTLEKPQKTKRKGFLGLFGKKESPKPTATTTMLQRLNNETVELNRIRRNQVKARIDSLVDDNVRLNAHIRLLVTGIDTNIRDSSNKKEAEIVALRKKSYKQIGILTIIVVILLVISYLIIHYDIRQRERGKRKLEESIRQNRSLLEMRKKIILTISHDIRGPLNVISGSAELAIDTRDKRKRDGYLNNARYLCRHVVHLLNNLLDVYRLNEAKETPNNVPFRLNVLFDRIAIGAAQIINDKGLLFKHDYRNIDVTIIGDEDRIEQIADNLLSNAVKFTQSGSVGIAASYEDGRLIMDISDTGIGMSEETVDRIFRPFERADNVEHVEGFGLGLSITKGLVMMLGGTIDVISNVGKGTTFHIAIPLELTGNIESANIPEVKPVGVLCLPHNVIVIDDDPLQRDIISEMLERNAVSCTVCATASDVVKAMRERDYDILLTDINMSGTNGFALLELLRKSNIGNSRTIPVVAMTARDDDENRPLIQCGFSGCIFKPFSMQELLERISIIMAKSLPLGGDRIDFSPLIANVANPVVILQGLADSTYDDIAELKESTAKSDKKAVSSVLHRIKPIWEMLGIENRLQPLRNAVKKRNTTTADIESLVSDVISAMENMIENINEELETIKDEEQDTDS